MSSENVIETIEKKPICTINRGVKLWHGGVYQSGSDCKGTAWFSPNMIDAEKYSKWAYSDRLKTMGLKPFVIEITFVNDVEVVKYDSGVYQLMNEIYGVDVENPTFSSPTPDQLHTWIRKDVDAAFSRIKHTVGIWVSKNEYLLSDFSQYCQVEIYS